MNNGKVRSGRPRILVDYVIVLRMREIDKFGWSRMAKAYSEITGRYVSRDTMKRRYLEAKARK